MKPSNNHIEHEIDRILQSASNKERVSTSPFFTTRVMGKVEQLEDNVVWFPKLQLVLRPVLALLFIVNIVNFYIYSSPSNSQVDNKVSIELAVNDYAAWNNDFILTDDLMAAN